MPGVFGTVSDKADTKTGDHDKRFVLRQYTVFHAAQLDGVTVPEIAGTAPSVPPIEHCTQLGSARPHRPAIMHGHQRVFSGSRP